MDGEFPLGLLVLELKAGFFEAKKWKVKQSDVFQYNQEEVNKFNKKFKAKEKKTQYSQELFRMQIRAFLKDEPSKT